MTTDTKTRLLDSAEQAARRNGFDGFSFAHLAADVGIRKASIHHHFPTKADLSIALIQRYNRVLEDDLAVLDAKNIHAAERLRRHIDRQQALLEDGNSLCLCVALSISRDALDERVVSGLRTHRSITLSWLQRAFADGARDGSIPDTGHPASEAATWLATLEGAQLAARAERNSARFDLAVALLRNRLGKPEEPA